MRKLIAFALWFVGLTLLWGPLAARSSEATPQGSSELKELTDIKQLQDLFNRDKGKPRLVLLLSPT